MCVYVFVYAGLCVGQSVCWNVHVNTYVYASLYVCMIVCVNMTLCVCVPGLYVYLTVCHHVNVSQCQYDCPAAWLFE